MLQWLISMIDMNERAKTIPGSLAKFDDMVMLVNTRHSDFDVPTVNFTQTVSSMNSIKATHMIPLWIQIQIVLGCDYVFVTQHQHADVHQCIAMLLDLGSLLHMREYTEIEVQALELNCRRYLAKVKATFASFSKSDFKFKKFHHAACHMGWCVRRFGALWVTCSGRWEHYHQTMKVLYRASSKRSRSYMREMILMFRKTSRLALARMSLNAAGVAIVEQSNKRPAIGHSTLVGRPVQCNMTLTLEEHDHHVPFDKKLYFEVWWCEFLQRKLLTQLIVQFAVTGMFKDVFDVHVFC